MSSFLEEVELLARLEIEYALDNQMKNFSDYIEDIFKFPMSEMISEYFVGGATFGTTIDDRTSDMDKDLSILHLHEKMLKSLKNSNFDEKDEKEVMGLFERVFMQGAHWGMIIKLHE